MSYLIVDVLGFTGVAGEKKATLGDSNLGDDSSLGQYGSLTNDRKAALKSEILKLSSAVSTNRPIGASGSNQVIDRVPNRHTSR